jgi:hypothetical protein
MANLRINTRLEYGLYALALSQPDLFKDAERFTPTMLAEDQDAARRVKKLIEEHVGMSPPCLCEHRCGDVFEAEDDPRRSVCKGLRR